MTAIPQPRAIKLTAADVNHSSPDAKSFAVHLDGQWIGWVGTARAWRGSRFGALKWWACWREDGDTAARWSSEPTAHPTRKAAIAALLAERTRPRDTNERTSPKSLTTSVDRWCTHPPVKRRRDWSDDSAELELWSGYSITVTRTVDGAVRWAIITHDTDLPLPGYIDTLIEGDLPADREKAVCQLIAAVAKWADR
ncbi:hypothetical protein ACFVH4_19210 [Nocardia ignorata]|uniref:hypothetical protein n=1 Tax=Nocardia ignorata TaxID=145285 RepID=UPI0036370D7B